MKPIYFFDEGSGRNKKLLGGKGAGLIEMTRLGLPVPPGFTITTEVCTVYYDNNKKLPRNLMPQVKKNIQKIERKTGKEFGSLQNPLLVSVRSGAAISMPGMMDTILNLGLNDQTVIGLADASKNPRFAWDSYRRFVQLFGKVVFGIDDKQFDEVLQNAKRQQNVQQDHELSEQSLREIVSEYKSICQQYTGKLFPEDPYNQLALAIEAVFKSWMGERAVVYREKYKITKEIANGTAVSVVTMVFGNMGNDSVTGVIFTRNPSDGTRQIFGDYLVNAQGEDVVAGIRTPQPIDAMIKELPATYQQLMKTCEKLEKHFKEPQDIEFTVEKGRFYLLQTRAAKMNAAGMIKTSVDMLKERLISKERAILRLNPEDLDQLLHNTIDNEAAKNFNSLTKGIPASPGAASGKAIFDVKKAIQMGEEGVKVILVREETKPEDVPAFFASVGILTSRGGKTSHAAVVARGMGKPCIVGCNDMRIDYPGKKLLVDSKVVSEGEVITIDGSTGKVYVGEIPTVEPKLTDDFKTILGWAQKLKKLGIRANADTSQAAKLARIYGAEGIGLCRTERMFNARDRLPVFVEMIMAKTVTERKEVLEKLRLLQKEDFKEILRIMEGYHVTIRLLDPPLHEFLPNIEELINKIHLLESKGSSDELTASQRFLQRAKDLAEVNPMMGHRGVRVGITYPEIYEMQIRAICEAAAELTSENINNIHPQIMVPQVGSVSELDYIKKIYQNIKSDIEARSGIKLKINFGTMLEVVRACLTSDELAKVAEFFSFGTNDLTQAVFSFSREDVEGKFLPEYIEKEIIKENPFESLDSKGVGSLMQIAISKGRSVKPDLEIGICGEHGGDPRSVKFCHKAGLTYVSASSHRVPIAILAAAQVALEKQMKIPKTRPGHKK
ncbi:MAG: pyruvate, phosphate dikinase [Thaumarchaeota archaeon 13_1_40CM_2_39_13_2]|nr:MAG: pyruvate, phosphate dikinase [Thaumarchaeota archaeon 13_1_40CM_2_39_13_2]OLE41005.1 MAG: pyruvate, phosphate dikinase [Thaumarchaeota archaeon 13_1_20CM_2_39_20]